MAIRSVSFLTFQPGAGVADTVNLVDATHISIQGSTATERLVVQEVFLGGLVPSTSSPMVMTLCRHSTFGAGTIALSAGAKDAVTDASVAAGTARGYTSVVTTKPQRSATLGLLAIPFNAFGGNFKWYPANIPGKDISTVGNTASLGELGVSAFTGSTAGAAMGGHIIYEQM